MRRPSGPRPANDGPPDVRSPNMYPRACLLAAAMSATCAPEVTEIRLGELEFDYAFIVFLSVAGDPVRVGPVFGEIDGAPFGVNDLEFDDEDRVLLVTMTDEQLRDAVPGFQAERAAELMARLERPPARPTFVDLPSSSPAVRRLALPTGVGYYSAPLDGRARTLSSVQRLTAPDPKTRAAVTLFVPVDAEFCARSRQSPLRPFAKDRFPITALPVPAEPSVSLVGGLAWLNANELVVLGFREVYIVRRGLPWQPTSGRIPGNMYIQPKSADDEPLQYRDVAVEPLGSDGKQVVWIAGGYHGEPEDPGLRRFNARGMLWRLTVGAQGIELVETATETPGHHLWSVAVDSDGAVVAGGDGGLIIRRDPGADRFEVFAELEVARPQEGADWVSVLRPFDFAPIRWVAGTQGLLHGFNDAQARWTAAIVIPDIVTSPQLYEFFSLAGRRRPNDDLELWASASEGGLLRREGLSSPWAPVQPKFPPRFAACASALDPNDPQLMNQKPVYTIALQDDFLHVGYANCTAVVMIKLDDIPNPDDPVSCVSLLTEDGEFPGFTPSEFRGMVSRPGELVVLRADGLLLSSTWATEQP